MAGFLITFNFAKSINKLWHVILEPWEVSVSWKILKNKNTFLLSGFFDNNLLFLTKLIFFLFYLYFFLCEFALSVRMFSLSRLFVCLAAAAHSLSGFHISFFFFLFIVFKRQPWEEIWAVCRCPHPDWMLSTFVRHSRRRNDGSRSIV